MHRMTINQPSTLQAAHHLHGVKVLASLGACGWSTIYFLSGVVVSQVIKTNALDKGWD